MSPCLFALIISESRSEQADKCLMGVFQYRSIAEAHACHLRKEYPGTAFDILPLPFDSTIDGYMPNDDVLAAGRRKQLN